MDKHEIGEEFKALDKKLDKQIRIINRITCVYFHKHKELLENPDMLMAYKHARCGYINFIRDIYGDASEEKLLGIFEELMDMELAGDMGNECEKYKSFIMMRVELLSDFKAECESNGRAWLFDEID